MAIHGPAGTRSMVHMQNIHQPELELVDNALYHLLPDRTLLLAIGAMATGSALGRGVGTNQENVGQER
jgi:hypothetical protein